MLPRFNIAVAHVGIAFSHGFSKDVLTWQPFPLKLLQGATVPDISISFLAVLTIYSNIFNIFCNGLWVLARSYVICACLNNNTAGITFEWRFDISPHIFCSWSTEMFTTTLSSLPDSWPTIAVTVLSLLNSFLFLLCLGALFLFSFEILVSLVFSLSCYWYFIRVNVDIDDFSW